MHGASNSRHEVLPYNMWFRGRFYPTTLATDCANTAADCMQNVWLAENIRLVSSAAAAVQVECTTLRLSCHCTKLRSYRYVLSVHFRLLTRTR